MKNKSLNELELELVKEKEWLFMGETDSNKRPTNSLVSKKDISFDVVEQKEPISNKQNLDIQRLTLQRLREGTFDNYNFSFKEELAVENEEIDENEEVEDLVGLYNDIESELLKISDFGAIGFLPDVKIEIKQEETKMKKKKTDFSKIKNVTVLK